MCAHGETLEVDGTADEDTVPILEIVTAMGSLHLSASDE